MLFILYTWHLLLPSMFFKCRCCRKNYFQVSYSLNNTFIFLVYNSTFDHDNVNNLVLDSHSLKSSVHYQPAVMFSIWILKCKEYMTNYRKVTEYVFHCSMLCPCHCLLLFGDSEIKAKREREREREREKVRGYRYLTLLLPEIPPVHLSARPGSPPGPGSFHYGTAEGHSHQAGSEGDKVKHWSVVNPLKIMQFTLYTCKECYTLSKYFINKFMVSWGWEPMACYTRCCSYLISPEPTHELNKVK